MVNDDTAAELAGGLPAYYPSSSESTNYSLLEPIAEAIDDQEEDTDEVDIATTIQHVGTSRQDFTVDAGTTVTVEEGEQRIYRDVIVEGTLIVNGTLGVRSIDTSRGEIQIDGELNTSSLYRDESIDRLHELSKLIDVPPREGETVEHYRSRLIAEYSLLTGKATIEDLIVTTAEVLDIDSERITFDEPAGGERGTAELGLPASALDEYELDDAEMFDILDRLLPAGYRLFGFRRGTFTYITPAQYNVNDFDADQGYDGLDGNGDPKDNGGTYAGVIQ